MKAHRTRREPSAFTLIELLVLIATLAVLFLVVLPLSRSRHHRPAATRIACVCNLKQISLGFRIWAADNNDRYPMQASVTEGSTLELLGGGNAFRHFQALSNELQVARILWCPADSRRTYATNFSADLNRTKISYFVGVDAVATNAMMLLAGDRNITNGLRVQSGLLPLATNPPAGWTHQLHNCVGNVAFADGHVEQVATARLRQAIAATGVATNRLAMP